MKAAVFEGVERIVVREWPDPSIKPDEILGKIDEAISEAVRHFLVFFNIL